MTSAAHRSFICRWLGTVRVPVTVTVTGITFHAGHIREMLLQHDSVKWPPIHGTARAHGCNGPGRRTSGSHRQFLRARNGRGGFAPDTANDRPSTISEVAHDFGITLRALRFYEAKRLLVPRRRGATRLYRRNNRERLAIILTGRRLGFTLAEIGLLLGRPNGKGLHLTREQCVMQINLLEQQKRGIEIAIAELRRI
jgi:DNA-binding transcriptional MerR regulator